MKPNRRVANRASLLKMMLITLAVWIPHPACGFIGVLGGRDRGACERDGGLCYTEDACCADYSCQKASQSTYGRCTPTKARLLSDFDDDGKTGDENGSSGGSAAGEACAGNGDCPPGHCCGAKFFGPRALDYRRVCRPTNSPDADCLTSGMEQNLFNQYYSALFR